VTEAREHVLRFDWAQVARETTELYVRLTASERDRLTNSPR
jgi:hypothetical protein